MATYTALVTRVIDGDTIEVRYDTLSLTIRLDNINTPESDTVGGSAATDYLRSLIAGQLVEIEERGTDIYGRTLAHIWRVSDILRVNQSIVDAGYSEWIR